MPGHLMNGKCTISYYAEGARNDLNEPTRTLTERAADVPCRIEARSKILSYEFPQRIRFLREQGLIEQTTHIGFMNASQTVEAHDIITYLSEDYTVATTVPQGNSHQEILLIKSTGQ